MRIPILLLIILLSTSAFPEIYKCTHVDGKVSYTNVPRSDCHKVDLIAPRWITLGDPSNQLYFDLESFVLLPKQNTRKAWLLINIPPKDSPNTNIGHQSEKWRVVINCTNKTYLTTQLAFYEGQSGEGKVVNSSNAVSAKPIEPTPESIMELAVTELCKRKK